MEGPRSVTVRIAGKDYALNARNDQMEQLMRLAAETINKKIEGFDAKYPDRPLEDKLAFVALGESVSRLAAQKNVAALQEEAKELQTQMDNYLDSIEKTTVSPKR